MKKLLLFPIFLLLCLSLVLAAPVGFGQDIDIGGTAENAQVIVLEPQGSKPCTYVGAREKAGCSIGEYCSEEFVCEKLKPDYSEEASYNRAYSECQNNYECITYQCKENICGQETARGEYVLALSWLQKINMWLKGLTMKCSDGTSSTECSNSNRGSICAYNQITKKFGLFVDCTKCTSKCTAAEICDSTKGCIALGLSICTDTDPNDDVHKVGVTKDKNGNYKQDTCSGVPKNKVSETYCLPDGTSNWKAVDCPIGEICNKDICAIECTSDADCTSSAPKCSPAGVCVECLTDANCASGKVCKNNICTPEQKACTINSDGSILVGTQTFKDTCIAYSTPVAWISETTHTPFFGSKTTYKPNYGPLQKTEPAQCTQQLSTLQNKLPFNIKCTLIDYSCKEKLFGQSELECAKGCKNSACICTSDADCTPSAPKCNPAGVCVECLTDANCASGKVCSNYICITPAQPVPPSPPAPPTPSAGDGGGSSSRKKSSSTAVDTGIDQRVKSSKSYCGDGICYFGETHESCSTDCPADIIPSQLPYCGDGNADYPAEDCETCEKDVKCEKNEICKDGECVSKGISSGVIIGTVLLLGALGTAIIIYLKLKKKGGLKPASTLVKTPGQLQSQLAQRQTQKFQPFQRPPQFQQGAQRPLQFFKKP